MRYSFFLILLITISSLASAQWRPNPYYFYFKGLKADTVMVVPRDTINNNPADSGSIAFKNGSMWFRNKSAFRQMGVMVSSYIGTLSSDSVLSDPNPPGSYLLYIQSDTLKGKTILFVTSGQENLYPVNSLDLVISPWPPNQPAPYYYDKVRGRVWVPAFYSPQDSVSINVILADM